VIVVSVGPMDERLSKSFNSGLRRPHDPKKFKELQEKWLRPENLPHGKVPKLNSEVHQDSTFKGAEVAMKTAQEVCVYLWSIKLGLK
jgi:hypothetical protein